MWSARQKYMPNAKTREMYHKEIVVVGFISIMQTNPMSIGQVWEGHGWRGRGSRTLWDQQRSGQEGHLFWESSREEFHRAESLLSPRECHHRSARTVVAMCQCECLCVEETVGCVGL